jgi:hypothetical protein
MIQKSIISFHDFVIYSNSNNIAKSAMDFLQQYAP